MAERYTLLEHARDIAALLSSPWEASGHVRGWHARYMDRYGNLSHATVVQRRGLEGFQVGIVRPTETFSLNSSIVVTVEAACVWMDLDRVDTPLDWHHEL